MQHDTLTLLVKLLPAILALLIPIAAIVGGLMMRLRGIQATHETIRRLGEAGQPIPRELLLPRDPYGRWTAKHQLHAGAINTGLGFGLMGMFYAIKPTGWVWAIGFIPLSIGVAMLIVWKVERSADKGSKAPVCDVTKT